MDNSLNPDRRRDKRFEELDALLLQENNLAEQETMIPSSAVIMRPRARPRVTAEMRALIVQLTLAGCGWRTVVEKTGTPKPMVMSVLRQWRMEKAKRAGA